MARRRQNLRDIQAKKPVVKTEPTAPSYMDRVLGQPQTRAERDEAINRTIRNFAIGTAVVIGLIILVALFIDQVVVPSRPVASVNGQVITVRDFRDRVRFERARITQLAINTQQRAQEQAAQYAAIFQQDEQTLLQQILENEPQYQTWVNEINFPDQLGQRVLNDMIDDVLVAQEAAKMNITVDEAKVIEAQNSYFGYDATQVALIGTPGTATPTPTITSTPFVSPTPTTEPTATVLATEVPGTTAEATLDPLATADVSLTAEVTADVVASTAEATTDVVVSTAEATSSVEVTAEVAASTAEATSDVAATVDPEVTVDPAATVDPGLPTETPTIVPSPTLPAAEVQATYEASVRDYRQQLANASRVGGGELDEFFREQAYRDAVGETLLGEGKATYVSARHILVDTEEKALEIVDALKNGASFADLAAANSSDGSAQNGGELGWAPVTNYVKEFKDAVTTLPIGQISDPVKTEFGYHIIQVRAREDRDVTEADRSSVQNALFAAWLEEIRTANEANIERYDWTNYVPQN